MPLMPNQRLFFMILAAALAWIACSSAAEPPAEGDRLFALHVKGILVERCFACHGGEDGETKGGFDLTTRDGLFAGGESIDQLVEPGDPGASSLIDIVEWADPDYEMPPKENDRLTPREIDRLRRWIELGAPWPDEETQAAIALAERARPVTDEGILVPTSGGLADEWTYRRYQPDDLWALRPVVKPEVPGPEGIHPVDAFARARLAAAGFEPAPEADPVTLVRRVTHDLTGLPPNPEEIDAFVGAWKQDAGQAWASLVDRLLASPRYGERWAQHWLDIVRYADTGGYSNDFERSNAWRYRDYVVRAFNEDMPYDRFIIEQIAGDELADASVRERTGGDEAAVAAARLEGAYTPEESEWLVATGFLRMGPWDNAMVKDDEARQIYLDDVVNVVGQAFLATTMRCVKCHDHKFDPIPTRDYYRLYAAFAGTQMAERPVPFLESENRTGFVEGRRHVERMLAHATAERKRIVEKRETAAREWFAERGLAYVPEKERQDLPDEQKPPRNVGLDHVDEGQLKVREQDEWIWTRRLERYEPMAQSVYNAADPELTWNSARKLRIARKIDPDARPVTRILMGGSLEAPGDEVSPGVLSAVGIPVEGAADATDPFALPDRLEGRRLALARWIADPRNPLTARSIVNRVWQHHFGTPLAGNPNNFGATGAKPTHPELLDWLAADFVEHGWRFKRLHRLLLASQTYRRSSAHPKLEELRAADPDNAWFARRTPRRVTAEELRDSLLAVTGELNPASGGLPVMPEINMEVALQPRMIQFSLAPAYQPSPTPDRRNRRTLYAYRVRGQADPFLELFNQPNPNESCEARDAASVTPQVFTLLNSDVVTDRSIAFALRLAREAATLDARIDRAFWLALGRPAGDDERARLAEYVREMERYHARVAPEPPAYPACITRSLVEEFSGQTFEYQEILPVFEDYQRDRKPSDVGPEIRALADLGLLLFNTNEFAHLY